MSYPLTRADVLPALLRPAMYVGEPNGRTKAQWLADAVVEYLNAREILRRGSSGKLASTRRHPALWPRDPTPSASHPSTSRRARPASSAPWTAATEPRTAVLSAEIPTRGNIMTDEEQEKLKEIAARAEDVAVLYRAERDAALEMRAAGERWKQANAKLVEAQRELDTLQRRYAGYTETDDKLTGRAANRGGLKVLS